MVQQSPVERKPRWVVWAVLGLVGFVSLIATLGALKLVENAGSIIVQVIASSGIVLAAAVPLLRRAERQSAAAASDAASAAQDAGAAKEQTTNAHKTNLREELDERHEELVQLFKTQGAQLAHVVEVQQLQRDDLHGIKSDQRGIRRDIGRNSDMIVTLGETVAKHSTQLHELDKQHALVPTAAILKLLAEHPATEPKEITE